jgi:hypothetical protein
LKKQWNFNLLSFYARCLQVPYVLSILFLLDLFLWRSLALCLSICSLNRPSPWWRICICWRFVLLGCRQWTKQGVRCEVWLLLGRVPSSPLLWRHGGYLQRFSCHIQRNLVRNCHAEW